MINYKPTLIENLTTLFAEEEYPVVNENFLTSSIGLPCISYNLSNDLVRANGDTLGYSDVYYNLKVWGRDIAIMEDIAGKIDTMMRNNGFRRIATVELWNNGLGQKELRYLGLGKEDF